MNQIFVFIGSDVKISVSIKIKFKNEPIVILQVEKSDPQTYPLTPTLFPEHMPLTAPLGKMAEHFIDYVIFRTSRFPFLHLPYIFVCFVREYIICRFWRKRAFEYRFEIKYRSPTLPMLPVRRAPESSFCAEIKIQILCLVMTIAVLWVTQQQRKQILLISIFYFTLLLLWEI